MSTRLQILRDRYTGSTSSRAKVVYSRWRRRRRVVSLFRKFKPSLFAFCKGVVVLVFFFFHPKLYILPRFRVALLLYRYHGHRGARALKVRSLFTQNYYCNDHSEGRRGQNRPSFVRRWRLNCYYHTKTLTATVN